MEEGPQTPDHSLGGSRQFHMSSTMQSVNLVPTVQLPLTSHVADVRPNAQANGRASLHFFLTAILGSSCPAEVAQFLQAPPGRPATLLLSRMRLKSFTEDFILWNSIQAVPRRIAIVGVELAEIKIPEPVRWLYEPIVVVPPVEWAPDIILTSNVEAVVGPVFDGLRLRG
jgi:hypothetical protein